MTEVDQWRSKFPRTGSFQVTRTGVLPGRCRGKVLVAHATPLYTQEIIFKSQVTMASNQPKRKNADLETKYNALQEVRLGKKSKTAIAKTAGVSSSTLSHWLKNRSQIEEESGKSRSSLREASQLQRQADKY